jgi:hypothetical protein
MFRQYKKLVWTGESIVPDSATLQRQKHDAHVWVGLEPVQHWLSLSLRHFAIEASRFNTGLIKPCFDDVQRQAPSREDDAVLY